MNALVAEEGPPKKKQKDAISQTLCIYIYMLFIYIYAYDIIYILCIL